MDGVDFNAGTGVTTLKELYVYNNQFGNDTDNEIGKILYCHPASTNEDRQLKQVGLCEAIIQFSQSFSDNTCESLHTQKARYVFNQPEPGYWFVLVLSVPSVIKSSLEGIQVTDYHNDEVQDNVFQAYLDRLYQRFVLRNGKLQKIVEIHGSNGLVRVKELLAKFINRSLKKWDPNRAGISDLFFGLKFLPLNKQMFLHVQCFVNHLLMTWTRIKHVLVLQGTQLVWSGVGQRDIQVLYDFIIRDAISSHFREGGEHADRNGMILTCYSSLTLFDTGGPRDSHVKGSSDENPGKLCHMCVYKSKQTYVVMIMHDDETNFVKELCNKIDGYMQQHLVNLARQLTEEARRSVSSTNGVSHRLSAVGPFGLGLGSGIPSLPSTLLESPSNVNVKYIYLNYLNLEEKSSTGTGAPQGQLDAYKLFASLKEDLSKIHENGEIVVKMETDTWIVAKVSNRREYYAILNQRNTNILDIDEEIRKLTDSHLSQIFFQD